MSDPEFDQLDPELRDLLKRLKDVPEREPGPAAQGRSNYMAMAHRLAVERRASKQPRHTTVPAPPSRRINEWIGAIFLPFQRQRHFSTVRIFVTLVIVLGLVLGGIGGTVYAAQDSQPGQGLYTVKIISEDLRLNLTSNPEAKFQLALALADRRTLEIAVLLQEDELVPPAVAARLESHLLLAFDLAATMDETGQRQAMLQLQAQLMDQEQIIGRAQTNTQGNIDPVLSQIRQQTENQLQLIDSGLEDPIQFQQRLQQQHQNQAEPPAEDMATEESGSLEEGNGPGSGPNEQPGEGQMGPMTPTESPPAGTGHGPRPATDEPQQEGKPTNGGGGGNGPNNPEPGNSGSGELQTQATATTPGDGGGSGGKMP